MAEYPTAPLDETNGTGVPLPILLTEMPPTGDHPDWNNHHAFYHRKAFLNETVATQAVRYSRLQRVPVFDHRDFHVLYKGGVSVPDTEEDAFRLTVLSCAGYVPDEAVNVHTGEIEELTKRQRRYLQAKGSMHIENNEVVSRFLLNYVLQKGHSNVSTRLIGVVLDGSSDDAERLRAGRQLIEQATEVAAEPFDAFYREARKRRTLGYRAASHPERLVSNHVVRRGRRLPNRVAQGLRTVLARAA